MATKSTINDVTKKVFEQFIHELEPTGVSSEVIAQMRKVLLEDRTLSESAIKAAMTQEEQGQ